MNGLNLFNFNSENLSQNAFEIKEAPQKLSQPSNHEINPNNETPSFQDSLNEKIYEQENQSQSSLDNQNEALEEKSQGDQTQHSSKENDDHKKDLNKKDSHDEEGNSHQEKSEQLTNQKSSKKNEDNNSFNLSLISKLLQGNQGLEDASKNTVIDSSQELKNTNITDVHQLLTQFLKNMENTSSPKTGENNSSNLDNKNLTQLIAQIKNYLKPSENLPQGKHLESNQSQNSVELKQILSLLQGVKENKDSSPKLQSNISQIINQIKEQLGVKDSNTTDQKEVRATKSDILQNTQPITSQETTQKKGAEVTENKNISQNQNQTINNNTPLLTKGQTVLNQEAVQKFDHNAQTLNHKAILNRLSHQIKQTHMNGDNKMVMQLFPENLGKVTVHLNKGSENFLVKMIVDSSVIKDIIDSKMNDFKNQLEQSGISFSEVNVSLRGDQQKENMDEQSTQGRKMSHSSKKEDNSDVEESYGAELFSEHQSIRKNQNGLLDLVA